MDLECNYNKNSGDIWSKMNSYEHIKGSKLKGIETALIYVVIYSAKISFFPLLIFEVYAALFDDTYREVLSSSLIFVVFILIFFGAIIILERRSDFGKTKPKNFSLLTDLLTGSIDVDYEYL